MAGCDGALALQKCLISASILLQAPFLMAVSTQHQPILSHLISRQESAQVVQFALLDVGREATYEDGANLVTTSASSCC